MELSRELSIIYYPVEGEKIVNEVTVIFMKMTVTSFVAYFG